MESHSLNTLSFFINKQYTIHIHNLFLSHLLHLLTNYQSMQNLFSRLTAVAGDPWAVAEVKEKQPPLIADVITEILGPEEEEEEIAALAPPEIDPLPPPIIETEDESGEITVPEPLAAAAIQPTGSEEEEKKKKKKNKKRKSVEPQTPKPKTKKVKVKQSTVAMLYKRTPVECTNAILESLKVEDIDVSDPTNPGIISRAYSNYIKGVIGDATINRMCTEAGLRESKNVMDVSANSKQQMRLIYQSILNWVLVKTHNECKLQKRNMIRKEFLDAAMDKIKFNI